MRAVWVIAAVVVFAFAFGNGARADTATQSDPAFLGIEFGAAAFGCAIMNTTPGGPAYDAGLQQGDVFVKIGGRPIADPLCGDVQLAITSHTPGDTVPVEIVRDGERVTVQVTLASRSELLLRRIGRKMPSTDVMDVDGVRHYDLAEHKGTLVVGAYRPGCIACATTVDRIAAALEHRAPYASVLAVAEGTNANLPQLRLARGSVPLAVADPDVFATLSLAENQERVYFFVIDCHGVVKLIAPIAPDADDIAATAADVLAAAEQAEHARQRAGR